MTAYSLTGLAGLGTIQTEDSTKDAGLFFQPLPGSDSSSAIQLDIFGTTRTITITGKFVAGDSGYGTVSLFIVALDALVSGNQTAKSYISGKSGATYTVLVNSVTWKVNEGEVNSVDYVIVMQEGS